LFKSRVLVRDSERNAVSQLARLLTCSLTALVLTVGGWPTAAKADIISFSDTTETMSMSQSGSSLSQTSNSPCPGTGAVFPLEVCSQTYQKVGGFTLVNVVSSSGQSFATQPGEVFAEEIFEPDGTTPSDVLVLSVQTDNQIQLEFDSDIEGSSLLLDKYLVLLTLGGAKFLPSLSETGGVQDGFTLVWSQGSNDLVQFSSDIDPVPEPSSIVLLGGLLVIVKFFIPIFRSRTASCS
jgi:hypothetical protein